MFALFIQYYVGVPMFFHCRFFDCYFLLLCECILFPWMVSFGVDIDSALNGCCMQLLHQCNVL